MDFIKKNGKGLLFCLALAVPSAVLGKLFPVVGGPVFAILIGMILALVIKKRDSLESGVKYTSKKILQYAVVLLGFGLNLEVVMETGKQSLPIIVCTITTSLVISYILHRTMNIPEKISTLVGVGSSICGGAGASGAADLRVHRHHPPVRRQCRTRGRGSADRRRHRLPHGGQGCCISGRRTCRLATLCGMSGRVLRPVRHAPDRHGVSRWRSSAWACCTTPGLVPCITAADGTGIWCRCRWVCRPRASP